MRRIRCNHCGRILRKLFIENCDDVGDSRFEDTGYSVDDEGFIEVRVGSDGKLVCPNCGKKMPRILVHTFMQDGSDNDIPTDYIYDNGLIRFETDENWTGYYLQDDATDVPSKEMLETISCPFCLKNFKSDYISISEPLDVVLSIKGSEEKEC